MYGIISSSMKYKFLKNGTGNKKKGVIYKVDEGNISFYDVQSRWLIYPLCLFFFINVTAFSYFAVIW